MCDKYGNPIIAKGQTKNGRQWKALMYYSWAQEKKNEDTQAA
jgi:hypothetical protein